MTYAIHFLRTSVFACQSLFLKRLFFCWILIICLPDSNSLQAQNHINRDSIRLAKKLRRLQRKEKLQNFKFTFDAVRFGLEGTYLFQGLLSEKIGSFYANTRKLEGTTDFTFLKNTICLTTGMGYWSVSRLTNVPYNGYQYQNTGTYFRIGLDYNILKHMKQKFLEDAIFIGFRFGHVAGKHKINMLVKNIPWNWYDIRSKKNGKLSQFRYSADLPYKNYTANWFELVTGLRATVWRNFQMGYTFRYKVMMTIKNQHKNLFVNEVPGFGTTELKAKPSISYHVFYRIPFKKKNAK